jgi:hypothetical protein
LLSPLFVENYNELISFGDNNNKRMKLKLIEQHWPHINFDNVDRIAVRGMYLNVYLLISFSD